VNDFLFEKMLDLSDRERDTGTREKIKPPSTRDLKPMRRCQKVTALREALG
jgi:hypothetical protein